MRLDLEGKLADAQHLNENLQSEIARVKADNAASERELQQQLLIVRDQQRELEEKSTIVNVNGDGRYEELLRQHEDLKAELREQEEVISSDQVLCYHC